MRIQRLGGRRRRKVVLAPKDCEACGGEFNPKTSTQKYCTAVCRVTHYRSQGRWLPDPETATEEEIRELMSSYLRHTMCLPLTGEITFRW